MATPVCRLFPDRARATSARLLPRSRLTAGPTLSSLLVLLSSASPCRNTSFPSPDHVAKPPPAQKAGGERLLRGGGGLAFSPRKRPSSTPLPDLDSWRWDASPRGGMVVLVPAVVGDRRGESKGGDCRLRGGLPLRRARAGGVAPSLVDASKPQSRPLNFSAEDKDAGVEAYVVIERPFWVLKGSLRRLTRFKGHSSFRCGRLDASSETLARPE